MRAALILATLLMGTSWAVAQDTAEEKGGACAAVEDSLQRLTCFDKAFPKGSAQPEVAIEPVTPLADGAVSPWSVEVSTSALDDTPKVVAILRPNKPSNSFMGDVFLALRCVENTTDVVLGTDQFIMMQESAGVTTRMGDQPATTAQWGGSTNSTSVGLWNGAQAIPFIKSLRDNERLVVRVESSRRTDAEFDLADVSNVAAQIAKACDWPR